MNKNITILYLDDNPDKDFETDLKEEILVLDEEITMSVLFSYSEEDALEKLKNIEVSVLIIDLSLVDNGNQREGFEWFKKLAKHVKFIPVLFYSGYLHKIKKEEEKNKGEKGTIPLAFISKDEGLDTVAREIKRLIDDRIFEILNSIRATINQIEAEFLWEFFDLQILENKDEEFINEYFEKMLTRIGISLISDKLWGDTTKITNMLMIPPLSRTMSCWEFVNSNKEYHKYLLSGEILRIDNVLMIVLSSTCDIINNKVDSIICCKVLSAADLGSNEYSFVKEVANYKRPRYFLISPIREFNIGMSIVDFNEVLLLDKESVYEKLKTPTSENTVVASLLPPFSDRLITQFGNYFRIGTPFPEELKKKQRYDALKKSL